MCHRKVIRENNMRILAGIGHAVKLRNRQRCGTRRRSRLEVVPRAALVGQDIPLRTRQMKPTTSVTVST